MLTYIRALVVSLLLCFGIAGAASAQDAASDVFTVSGVRVDQTAADAAQARTQAFAVAQRVGLERLLRRLTTPQEAARLPIPRFDSATLDRLVTGIDVEEERRSGTRYVARLAVRYDPNGARAAFRNAGFTLTEARGPATLVIPIISGAAPGATDAWRQAWERGGYSGEMAPVLIAPIGAAASQDAAEAAAAAQAAGAERAMYAVVQVVGATVAADLTPVEAGAFGARSRVTAPIQGGDAGLPDALARLADSVNGRIQADWKARAASAAATPAKRLTCSALYGDIGEWTRMKQNLERAAASAVSAIRIEAIARDGALISFAYAGDEATLAQALRAQGLTLTMSPTQGAILQVAPR